MSCEISPIQPPNQREFRSLVTKALYKFHKEHKERGIASDPQYLRNLAVIAKEIGKVDEIQASLLLNFIPENPLKWEAQKAIVKYTAPRNEKLAYRIAFKITDPDFRSQAQYEIFKVIVHEDLLKAMYLMERMPVNKWQDKALLYLIKNRTGNLPDILTEYTQLGDQIEQPHLRAYGYICTAAMVEKFSFDHTRRLLKKVHTLPALFPVSSDRIYYWTLKGMNQYFPGIFPLPLDKFQERKYREKAYKNLFYINSNPCFLLNLRKPSHWFRALIDEAFRLRKREKRMAKSFLMKGKRKFHEIEEGKDKKKAFIQTLKKWMTIDPKGALEEASAFEDSSIEVRARLLFNTQKKSIALEKIDEIVQLLKPLGQMTALTHLLEDLDGS